MRCGAIVSSLLLVAGVTGCSSSLGKPTLQPQGPVSYQQRQAEKFDPFPDDTLGPAVVGGRPRDYGQPREPLPLRTNGAAAASASIAPTYAPAAYDSPVPDPSPFMPSSVGGPTPRR